MVRLRCTCRARRRPPTHLLNHPRWAAFRATEVAPSHGSCRDMAQHRLQASFRWVRTFTTGDWASSNPALAISCGSCGTPPWTPPVGHRFPGMLLSPTGFPSRSAGRPTNLPPSSSPLCGGYNEAPHGAHRACSVNCTRLSSVMNDLRYGYGNLASRVPHRSCRSLSPVSLRPVDGFPVHPGRT